MERAGVDQFALHRASTDISVVGPTLHAIPSSNVPGEVSAEEWMDLAQAASEPNPFFEPWFLQPSLELFAPDKVSMLRFGSDSELLGVMPVGSGLSYSGYPFPHLATWLHHNAFLGVPLVRKGWERPFWRAMLDWADRSAGVSLFLHLSHLPMEGDMFAALRGVISADGRDAAVVHREERAMLRSDLSPQEYYDVSMSTKRRKELRRQDKRLHELGEVRLDRHDDYSGLEGWSREYLELEARGWKGDEGSALGQTDAGRTFFYQTLHGAAARGRLQRLTLRLDDKPIAMLASFITPPGAFSFKTTYDESYSRFSPGVLLQRANLELLERDDIAWTDSCASADHPMIDKLWHQRRTIVRVSIAIGGKARRALARQIFRAETGSAPKGL